MSYKDTKDAKVALEKVRIEIKADMEDVTKRFHSFVLAKENVNFTLGVVVKRDQTAFLFTYDIEQQENFPLIEINRRVIKDGFRYNYIYNLKNLLSSKPETYTFKVLRGIPIGSVQRSVTLQPGECHVIEMSVFDHGEGVEIQDQ